MKSKLIVVLTALSLNGILYAADDTMPAKPPSGSATTAQESPSHPATVPATSSEKAGAGTTATQTPTHPATKENETTGQATGGSGARGVRDWTAIDIDRDHSISPEEMQKFLEKAWADKKQPT